MDKYQINKLRRYLNSIDNNKIEDSTTFINLYKQFTTESVQTLDDLINSGNYFFDFIMQNLSYLNISEYRIPEFIFNLTQFRNYVNDHFQRDRLNDYDKFSNIAEDFLPCGDSTHILDVGAGIFPTSSIYLGTKTDYVDGIEKEDIILSYETAAKFNVKLIGNTNFTPHTNVDNYDMLAGFAPCAATENLIVNASSHNKPYLIRYCECGLPKDKITGEMLKNWQGYFRDIDPKIKFYDKYIYNLDATPRQFERSFKSHRTLEEKLKENTIKITADLCDDIPAEILIPLLFEDLDDSIFGGEFENDMDKIFLELLENLSKSME